MEEEIGIGYTTSLEEAVNILLKEKAKGRHVYCEFNGHILHSDNITIDAAYLEVIGCTKKEFEKRQQAWRKSLRDRQDENRRKAIANIPEWIERGKKLIYPERYDEWKRRRRVKTLVKNNI